MERWSVLSACMLLGACGSFIDEGEYEMSGHLVRNTCPWTPDEAGLPQTVDAVWEIEESDGDYVLTNPSTDLEIIGSEDDDEIVFTESEPLSDANCSGNQNLEIRLKSSSAGVTGTMSILVVIHCSDGSSADCEMRYKVSGEKR